MMCRLESLPMNVYSEMAINNFQPRNKSLHSLQINLLTLVGIGVLGQG